MILLKNKDKKANIKIGNNIEIKDGNDFPFDLTLYGRSTQATSTNPVSPSPDYPSPIESVGRKNIIKSLSSKWSAGINYNLDNSLIKKTMTFSCIIDTSITSANLYIIPATDVSAISLGTINFTANQRATKTFNLTDEQIQVIKSNQGGIFQIYKSSAFESANITDAQLEKGTVATNYVPYEHTEISATVTGKNLFDENELTLNKTQVDNKTCYEIAGTTATTSNVLLDKQLEENTQYTLSMVAKKVQHFNMLYFYYTDGTETHKTFTNTNFQKISITSTANKTINKILIDTGDRGAKNYIEVGTIQLEKGTQTTEYEEYKSNSLTIDLQGNELCSLPNGTKDELVIENGIAKIIKRIGKVVLDENIAINFSGSYGGYYRLKTSIDDIYVSSENNYSLLSNYFKGDIGALVEASAKLGAMAQYRNSKIIYMVVAQSSGVDFKTWLSTHNTEVLYELAEPETINLGTVEMPHTYNGVSNITNSADTEMIVKYYKKFEFDKILRSGYNIDEQEYEIAKKQMANGKRKKILSSYIDCIIKIDLGLLDNKTYQEYKEQLEDGEYEYWSYKYNQYKKANFILTKPSITTEYAYDDDIGIDDLKITLEKSGDVDVTS